MVPESVSSSLSNSCVLFMTDFWAVTLASPISFSFSALELVEVPENNGASLRIKRMEAQRRHTLTQRVLKVRVINREQEKWRLSFNRQSVSVGKAKKSSRNRW